MNNDISLNVKERYTLPKDTFTITICVKQTLKGKKVFTDDKRCVCKLILKLVLNLLV